MRFRFEDLWTEKVGNEDSGTLNPKTRRGLACGHPAGTEPFTERSYRGTSLIRKQLPRGTLQKANSQGPMLVIGGGRFLLNEVTL